MDIRQLHYFLVLCDETETLAPTAFLTAEYPKLSNQTLPNIHNDIPL